MITWTYGTHPVHSHADLPEECSHIVYMLSYSDGTKYIGYKTIRSDRRMKPLKDMRKNAKRIVRKDLPFIKYTGSSKYNEGKDLVSKEILHLCSNKRTATYLEVKEMMVRGAIEPNSGYNNENILGKFFHNCIDGLLKDYNG